MLNKLESVLSDSFNQGPGTYDDNTSLMSFSEWDSMSHMLFITQIESTFSIQLTGEEIIAIKTVGDIKRVLIIKGVSL